MCDKMGANIKRFQKLIDNSGKTRPTIAKELGCDTSTITKHYNGDRGITTDYLIKYAKYFNVSADYLLGLSNAKSINPEMQAASKYTGLNDDSLFMLHHSTKSGALVSETNNFLLDIDNYSDFYELCFYLKAYRDFYSQFVDFREKMEEKYAVYVYKTDNPYEFEEDYDKSVELLQEIEDKRDVQIIRMHESLKRLIDKYCADIIERENSLTKDDVLPDFDDELNEEGDPNVNH